MTVIRIYVDFNSRELASPEGDVIELRLGSHHNKGILESELKVGDKVLIYAEDMECEAILRQGEYSPWVAVMIPQTIVHLPGINRGGLKNK